jgi:hypothetical protein
MCKDVYRGAETMTDTNCCERNLSTATVIKSGIHAFHPVFVNGGYAQDGDEWTCPTCGKSYVHYCDEAEGCGWRKS